MSDDAVIVLFRDGAPLDVARAANALVGASILQADAMRAVRTGQGFLELYAPAALLRSAAAALEKSGFPTVVIPLSQRVPAPTALSVRRIELADEQLRLRDPVGAPISWREIRFIHLARVLPKNLELGLERDESSAPKIAVGGSPLLTASTAIARQQFQLKQDAKQKAAAAERSAGNTFQTWLELLAETQRVRIRLESFVFDCLPPPLAPIARQNFTRLISELVRRSPGAHATPLAAEIASGKPLAGSGPGVDEVMHDRYISFLLTRAEHEHRKNNPGFAV
ncbi:hypothetical protein FGE12_12915 [Aggregicoccus sp. 17bor-14]|uniref:hypothetical protein n=1 Tax=Myxococcaceae TaxID=31 RepID=UPI00129C9532|nr:MULTISPECIES: hypothetical protein [Myxococcaceae]MBF5043293.1 hypothetical protein [Simulacricoccus sp. 17bor-14]MRI89051.1 hypothetical protein [Aggregicoccus sp. 17bor-14]